VATYVDTLPPPSSVLHRRGCPGSSWKPVTARDFGDPRARSSLCQSSAACAGTGVRQWWGRGRDGLTVQGILPVISTDGVTTWNAPHRLRRRTGAVADGSYPRHDRIKTTVLTNRGLFTSWEGLPETT
jgi:hypothetical protein